MVYPEALRYIYTMGVTVFILFVVTPIVYTFWFTTLRSEVNTSTTLGQMLQAAGDLYFHVYEILGFAIIILIIVWYFADAARKGTQTEVQN